MAFEAVLIIIVVLVYSAALWHVSNANKQLQSAINQQQDTIQRLINREPVTYAEVGATKERPRKEAFAAWGNQSVNLDEDESRQ